MPIRAQLKIEIETMKSKNSLIHAAAVAAITIGFSCVSNAQIYNQGVPIQQGAQGSGTVVGTPQVYRTPQPQYYNVDMNDEQMAKASMGASFSDAATGVSIRSVFTNGPAQVAGLSSGDVVTKVNGKAIQSAASFEQMIGGMKAGEMLSLVKIDDGKEKQVQCKLMTNAQIIKASTVPEAGPFDSAAQQGEQELAAMAQKIKNTMAELEDMKKRYAAEEKRVSDLKVKAKDARMKAEEMKKVKEANRVKRMKEMKMAAEKAANG